MIDNDLFVIDAVLHAYNLEPSNYAHREHAEAITAMVYGVVGGAPEGYQVAWDDYVRDWSVEESANLIFAERDTDVAVFHPVPITAYHDGLVSVEKAAEAREAAMQVHGASAVRVEMDRGLDWHPGMIDQESVRRRHARLGLSRGTLGGTRQPA